MSPLYIVAGVLQVHYDMYEEVEAPDPETAREVARQQARGSLRSMDPVEVEIMIDEVYET